MPQKRKCGKCTECCTTIAVAPLGKGTDEPCAHQGKGGCRIYRKRPNCCAAFTCRWLEGALSQELRPDKSGMILWQTSLISDQGTRLELLQCNVRPRVRWQGSRTFREILRFSEHTLIAFVQQEHVWLYHLGVCLGDWGEADFIRLDRDGNTYRLVVVPRGEVLVTDADEQRWEDVQRGAVTVSGDEGYQAPPAGGRRHR